MQFSFAGPPLASPWFHDMQQGLTEAMMRAGHEAVSDPDAAQLVFHHVDPSYPRPFRRKSQAVFVVGLVNGPPLGLSPVAEIYPLLLRSLSNLLIYGAESTPTGVTLVTPELGCYPVGYESSRASWFDHLYTYIAPLASSRLVITNHFDWNLPPELARGTPVTAALREASRVLARWHLFPTPYPLHAMLSPQDYRHLRRVFGIGGISYGNLSARHDATRFWMSASGVDKGTLGTVSRDILLVTDYDATMGAMRLSVSPGSKPLRVSVDAVEHWGIYRSHPAIGAMIHIHAWVEGVATTAINYPCGTVEMGDAMADLLRQDPHPERTIIGLRNHGITATGPNFADILARLEGRVQTQVPMQ